LPLSLFVVSVSSALLPELSAQWSSGNRDGMLAAIHHSLRLVLFFAIPAAIGLFCLSQPIANVLFLGREFKYADAVQTAQVLQVQAVAIVVVALARILAQGFYAIQNAWFPALASGVALVTHVFFAFGLTEAFGLRGLAAAAIFSALVNTLMLTTAYRSWIGKISFQRIGRSVAINVGCGAVMFGVLQLHAPFANVAQHVLGVSIATQAVALAVVIGLGAGSYFASAYAFKVPECHEALNMIRAKLKRHRR
jgi:putative peptidoglycan lipid II flippase